MSALRVIYGEGVDELPLAELVTKHPNLLADLSEARESERVKISDEHMAAISGVVENLFAVRTARGEINKCTAA